MFGTFDGVDVKGTKEEVDLALEFQKMIANFVKTGNPSTEKYAWPVYNNETRQKMMKSSNRFRYFNAFAEQLLAVAEKYPEILAFAQEIKILQCSDCIFCFFFQKNA